MRCKVRISSRNLKINENRTGNQKTFKYLPPEERRIVEITGEKKLESDYLKLASTL